MTDEQSSQSAGLSPSAKTGTEASKGSQQGNSAAEKLADGTGATSGVKKPSTPLQCFNGAAVSSVLAWGAYSLAQKIAGNFAAHPFQSTNYIAVNISVAVRTLVVGIAALATGVFALTALGLLGLGIQTLIQKLNGNASAS